MHILHQLEVAQNILDLGAVVEAEASDHVVLDSIAAKCLFYQPRLRVCPVQHGTPWLVLLAAGLSQILLHAVRNKQSLVLSIRRFVVPDQRTTLARRPE